MFGSFQKKWDEMSDKNKKIITLLFVVLLVYVFYRYGNKIIDFLCNSEKGVLSRAHKGLSDTFSSTSEGFKNLTGKCKDGAVKVASGL